MHAFVSTVVAQYADTIKKSAIKKKVTCELGNDYEISINTKIRLHFIHDPLRQSEKERTYF